MCKKYLLNMFFQDLSMYKQSFHLLKVLEIKQKANFFILVVVTLKLNSKFLIFLKWSIKIIYILQSIYGILQKKKKKVGV